MFYKRFDSGLRLVVEETEGIYSCCMGIMVKVGSRYETDKDNGICHFIEHTTFKGTEKRDSFKISDDTEFLGAKSNAATSKENTFYYLKSTFDKIEESFEILSDIFVNSVYPEKELESEKGVVIEEIDMVDDIPDEVCLDLLSQAFFGDAGLGKTILGPKENIKRFTREDILAFRQKNYTAENCVVVFAGKIDEKVAEDLVLKYVEGRLPKSKEERVLKEQKIVFGEQKVQKKIAQTHFALAFKGVEFGSENVDLMNVASTVLGGGMSSRLFQSIRERLGLCYTVYSYPSFYLGTGSLMVYAGVNDQSFERAYTEVMKELSVFKKEGISQKEFERAKNTILSSLIMSQESNVSLAMAHAKYLLSTDTTYDYRKKIEKVEKLEYGKANEFIKEFLNFDDMARSLVSGSDKTFPQI